MNNNNFFYINKLSNLHNGKNIFFCKTDYISKDFQTISELNNKIILISGNSDYAITDDLVNIAPKNIVKWYCQNALSNNPIICPIPIGMENKEECSRSGHGCGYYERVTEKENIINSLTRTTILIPNKFIYANFDIKTNQAYRTKIKNCIQNIEHIDWEEPNLTLQQFFNTIIQYKMVLCPIGNGVDTHRLWEVLYCNRIPITIMNGNFKIYELYKQLPIIILDKMEDLLNYNLIEHKYNTIISTKYNLDILDSSYWKEKILYEHK